MSRVLRSVWLGSVPYRAAWALQRRLAQALRSAELDSDCLLLLEHPPVYTMGRSGRPQHLPEGVERLRRLGADYLTVDRGGSITFHGPGQLVAYPIVRVAGAFPMGASGLHGDVIRYLRALEEAVIVVVAGLGVRAGRRPPFTGVWVGDSQSRKLAAIGLKVAGGVTTHGVALNVNTELQWFDHIIPCGIEGAGVTSLRQEGVSQATPLDVASPFAAALARELGEELALADEQLDQLTHEVLASSGALPAGNGRTSGHLVYHGASERSSVRTPILRTSPRADGGSRGERPWERQPATAYSS
ncbi:MAG TPA: lipoyl(octanoyl) transferase LipB [Candidatus Sulfotelmatobacter sp.]|nr:lipoyl(octanoyl) transferase LipB [Candidatus Sulfotelmatobacter sp.]